MSRIATIRPLFVLLAIVGALAFAGCGESEEEKALASICTSKADIQKQVETLSNITPANFTSSAVTDALTAIRNDVKSITEQTPKVKDSLKPELEQANSEFQSELLKIGSELLRSISAEDAAQQATDALAELVNAYQSAYASLDCPDQ